MAMLAIDTHARIKELVASGMPERQAEAVVRQQAEIVSDNLATKQDIELLEKKLLIKLGAMMIAGFIFITGVLLTALPMVIQI